MQKNICHKQTDWSETGLLQLIEKMTHFLLWYLMGVIDSIMCVHLNKILKSRLQQFLKLD